MRQEMDRLEADLERQKLDVEVAEILSESLSEMNSRDAEANTRTLNAIKKALEKEIDGSIDLMFGGSVKKHTYVDGLSDIDTLVILNKSELALKTPDEARSYFVERLTERFPDATVVVGRLAVTIRFQNTEIQLLPALKHGNALKIPKADGDGWSRINPKEFTEALTRVNQALGGKVVPTIKLAKSIIADFPKEQRLSGYHVEALAIQIFRDYSGTRTTKNLITEFLAKASEHLRRPIADPTGQSTYVDEYLGGADSNKRQQFGQSMDRIAAKMANADRDKSLKAWADILK
jgi:hypothetical protein